MSNEMRKHIDTFKSRMLSESNTNEQDLYKIIDDIFDAGRVSEQKVPAWDVYPYTFDEYWNKNKEILINKLKKVFTKL